jgi:hypothetical protein
MTLRRTGIVLAILCFVLAGSVHAQGGGQFCVRAFEDRNGNGTLDSNEPLLTSGVSGDLLNAENVIVASALLADSPTAAQGVICFQFLAPGQYSLIITSPEFNPTTPNTVTASISEGTLPTVVEFGGMRTALEPTISTGQSSGSIIDNLTGLVTQDRDTLARIVISLLGTLVIVAAMIVLGSLIYVVFFRRSQIAAYPPAYYGPPSSGTIPPVTEDDTHEVK